MAACLRLLASTSINFMFCQLFWSPSGILLYLGTRAKDELALLFDKDDLYAATPGLFIACCADICSANSWSIRYAAEQTSSLPTACIAVREIEREREREREGREEGEGEGWGGGEGALSNDKTSTSLHYALSCDSGQNIGFD